MGRRNTLARTSAESLITTTAQRDQRTDGPVHWAPSPPTTAADHGGNQSGRSQHPFQNRPTDFPKQQTTNAAPPALAFFQGRVASHRLSGGGSPQGSSAWHCAAAQAWQVLPRPSTKATTAIEEQNVPWGASSLSALAMDRSADHERSTCGDLGEGLDAEGNPHTHHNANGGFPEIRSDHLGKAARLPVGEQDV